MKEELKKITIAILLLRCLVMSMNWRDAFYLNSPTSESPRLSIIIPMYNDEEYIRQCIESILVQSYKNYEIIIIDDGSTDKSLDIVDRYLKQQRHMTLIKNKVNCGTFLARKTGINKARGEFCCFLDADDSLYNEHSLEIMVNEATKHNTDIIQFRFSAVGAAESVTNSFYSFLKLNTNRLDGSLNILYDCFRDMNHHWRLWGKLFRMSVCKRAFAVLPDIYDVMGEDILSYFAICFFSQSYIGFDEVVYTYRLNSGISTKQTIDLATFNMFNSGDFNASSGIRLFLKMMDANLTFTNLVDTIYHRSLSMQMNRFHQLDIQDSMAGLDLMITTYPIPDISWHLWDYYWRFPQHLSVRLSRRNRPLEIKHIGIYCSKHSDFVAIKMSLSYLERLGIAISFISEKKNQTAPYFIALEEPPSVKRCEELYKSLIHQRIDLIVILTSDKESILFLDILVAYLSKIPVVDARTGLEAHDPLKFLTANQGWELLLRDLGIWTLFNPCSAGINHREWIWNNIAQFLR